MTAPLRHRLEDRRLLTGQGRFSADETAPGALVALFLRAPVAHGRVRRLDVADARALPGVAGVFTGADFAAAGIGPLPCESALPGQTGPDFPVLAGGTVRFVGEALALILAETEAQARDAVEAIALDIDDLPAETDTATASQIAFTWEAGDAAAVEAALADAAHVVSFATVNNRVVVSPLEPRAALGAWDARTGRFTLFTQTQGVHVVARTLAVALGVAPGDIEVFTGDVGGSFGIKLPAYPEQAAILAAARLTGRPVRWVSDRTEAFLADGHGRDHAYTGTLALDRDGRFLAFRLETRASLGAYASPLGPYTPTKGAVRTLGHSYGLDAVHMRVEGVLTHNAPTVPYRGAGKPETVYILERAIDKAARELGLDRVDLRRRNLVRADAMPFRAANGEVYDSGDFAGPLDAVLAAADWPGASARRAAVAARGKRHGIGLGLYVHSTGGRTSETTRLALLPDGRVEVATGLQAAGQGHETVLAQIVADKLDIPAERVVVVEGAGARVADSGTGGSSSLPIGGATALAASERFLDAARAAAAEALETAPADLTYAEGTFSVVGTDRRLALGALARDLDARGAPACAGEADFEGRNVTYPNGAYVCEVEVDPDTGRAAVTRFVAADDLGVRVNPRLAAGQLVGAIAQGIGQALFERTVYDPDTGQMLSASFMDYGLPRADDLPGIEIVAADRPTSANPLGAKGAGEVGCLGAPAAVMNALADALGTDAIHMPATPEAIWRALRSTGRSAA